MRLLLLLLAEVLLFFVVVGYGKPDLMYYILLVLTFINSMAIGKEAAKKIFG